MPQSSWGHPTLQPFSLLCKPAPAFLSTHPLITCSTSHLCRRQHTELACSGLKTSHVLCRDTERTVFYRCAFPAGPVCVSNLKFLQRAWLTSVLCAGRGVLECTTPTRMRPPSSSSSCPTSSCRPSSIVSLPPESLAAVPCLQSSFDMLPMFRQCQCLYRFRYNAGLVTGKQTVHSWAAFEVCGWFCAAFITYFCIYFIIDAGKFFW